MQDLAEVAQDDGGIDEITQFPEQGQALGVGGFSRCKIAFMPGECPKPIQGAGRSGKIVCRPGELERVVVMRSRFGKVAPVRRSRPEAAPGPAVGAVLMSVSTIVVAANAQLLRRTKL